MSAAMDRGQTPTARPASASLRPVAAPRNALKASVVKALDGVATATAIASMPTAPWRRRNGHRILWVISNGGRRAGQPRSRRQRELNHREG